MNFILDTNILFSALVRDSITRKILFSPKFKFFLPEYSLFELKRYIPIIAEKGDLKEKDVGVVLTRILEKAVIIPFNKYKKNLSEGIKIIGSVDENDVPFIATALSIKNDGIWTNDKHFKYQGVIKIVSTSDMINLLKSSKIK